MIHVNHDKRLFRLGISETEHAATQPGGHLGFHSIIVQFYRIIVGRCPFFVVRITRTIAFIGIFARSGVKFHFTRSGDEKKVSQIRNTCPAQVSQAETQYGSMVILITGSRIIKFRIGIRTDLDSPERYLRTGIYIAVSVCSDQWSDVLRQVFSVEQTGKQKQSHTDFYFLTQFHSYLVSWMSPTATWYSCHNSSMSYWSPNAYLIPPLNDHGTTSKVLRLNLRRNSLSLLSRSQTKK